MNQFENMEQNRNTVLNSTLLAKAVIRHTDGSLEVIAAFEQSTVYDFFWTFFPKSKNKRAPRTGWGKPRATFARHHSTRDYSNIHFKDFVAFQAKSRGAEVLSVRVYKARKLAAVQTSPAHQGIGSDWTPRVNSTDLHDYQLMHRKLDSKISGRMPNESWRR